MFYHDYYRNIHDRCVRNFGSKLSNLYSLLCYIYHLKTRDLRTKVSKGNSRLCESFFLRWFFFCRVVREIRAFSLTNHGKDKVYVVTNQMQNPTQNIYDWHELSRVSTYLHSFVL